MHEVGLVAAAIETATREARRAGAIRVDRLIFEIVEGGHLTPDAVETVFATLSRDTIAAGAALTFEPRTVARLCPACGVEYPGDAEGGACPSCGQIGWPTHGGTELILVGIDVSLPEGGVGDVPSGAVSADSGSG